MRSTVVFTGKGYVAGNNPGSRLLRSRATWSKMAEQMGFDVANAVDGRTRYLVSSTSTTKKARDAKARGVTVLTYEAFEEDYQTCLERGLTNSALSVLDDLDPVENAVVEPTAEDEAIPGWGMF